MSILNNFKAFSVIACCHPQNRTADVPHRGCFSAAELIPAGDFDKRK